jgi:hypothetical protein
MLNELTYTINSIVIFPLKINSKIQKVNYYHIIPQYIIYIRVIIQKTVIIKLLKDFHLGPPSLLYYFIQ